MTFGNSNRYGLIGANGCGKSTFMKILAGELEPTVGNVSVDPNARIGQLSQDQFAYEEYRVIDAVIMGYERLWEVMQERNRIYSLAEMSDEEGMRVAELEMIVGSSAVWEPYIPQRVALNRAVGARRPIHSYGQRTADICAVFDLLWQRLVATIAR